MKQKRSRVTSVGADPYSTKVKTNLRMEANARVSVAWSTRPTAMLLADEQRRRRSLVLRGMLMLVVTARRLVARTTGETCDSRLHHACKESLSPAGGSAA